MADGPVLRERLDSWKEIAAYVGRNVRTVIRWEQQRGLPVHRVPGGGRQVVFAYPDEIDEWMEKGDTLGEDADAVPTNLATAPEIEETKEVKDASPAQTTPHLGREISTKLRFHSRRILWGTGFLALACIGVFATRIAILPKHIRFTDVTQITSDGFLKEALVTDGREIFFGEARNGREILAAVPIEGGEIRLLPTPADRMRPAAISSDGAQLLALARTGEEAERDLWIIPTRGGLPRRVGEIRCHAAGWSPQGDLIAYTVGNALYLSDKNGKKSRLLHRFSGVPEYFVWSSDGNRIRVASREADLAFSIWDLILNGSTSNSVQSIVPMYVVQQLAWNLSFTLDTDGNSFARERNGQSDKIEWLASNWNKNRLTKTVPQQIIESPGDLALDPRAEILLVTGRSAAWNSTHSIEQSSLFSTLPSSQQFKPFLPGVPATDVNFSKNGSHIVYVCSPERTLWVDSVDNSHPLKIPLPTEDVELPRWSPDGRQIAFMGRMRGESRAVYIISAEGKNFRKVSTGSDQKGAPTWSPDGQQLIYGNVNCQELGNCVIHRLDLETGKESLLPGSEGLSTARWSPDGHLVAALRTDTQEVFVYRFSEKRWWRIAENINGNDLEWSDDSKYLFAIRPIGKKPQILRISMADGSIEPVADLSPFSKTAEMDTWFTVSPDGVIIFRKAESRSEIYALRFKKE